MQSMSVKAVHALRNALAILKMFFFSTVRCRKPFGKPKVLSVHQNDPSINFQATVFILVYSGSKYVNVITTLFVVICFCSILSVTPVPVHRTIFIYEKGAAFSVNYSSKLALQRIAKYGQQSMPISCTVCCHRHRLLSFDFCYFSFSIIG